MGRIVPVIAALALLMSCNTSVDRKSLEKEVLEADRSFGRAVAQSDAEAFARYISNDAVFFVPDGVARGRMEVLEQWETYLDEDRLTEISWGPETVEVAGAGDYAVTRGHYRITGRVAVDKPSEATGYYVTVWRHSAEDGWQVISSVGIPEVP